MQTTKTFPDTLNLITALFACWLMSFIAGCDVSVKSVSDFDKFTGRWSLDIVEAQDSVDAPWVPAARYVGRKGFIIYDGMGGMGVHHVPANYESYKIEGKGDIDNLTETDLRHLADNFVYFGSYTVNDSAHIVTHYIESSSNPSQWYTDARRAYEFSGDTLTLVPVKDTYPFLRVRWIRTGD